MPIGIKKLSLGSKKRNELLINRALMNPASRVEERNYLFRYIFDKIIHVITVKIFRI